MLEIRTFARADAFLRMALPFLESADAENGLLTSAALACENEAERPGRRWLLASRDSQTVAAALAMAEGRLALSLAAIDDAYELGAHLASQFKGERAWTVLGPRPTAESFARAWGNGLTPAPLNVRQILLCLPIAGVRFDSRLAWGRLRPAHRSEAPLLQEWMRAFDAETGAIASQPPAEAWVPSAIALGNAYVWEDDRGRPAGTASVGGRTRRAGRIHLVYVPPGLRRLGVAAACVRGICAGLQREGRIEATLFADARSAGALGLYRSLGFDAACEIVELAL